jgi:hypothetical protein
MLRLRVAVVVVICTTVACGGGNSDVSRAVPSSNSAEVERGQLESVISLIPARELCSEPMDAPARRANFAAATRRHKETMDSIARLNWRTDEITPEQIEAWNAAKRQLNRAEVIDLAIAVRQDFKPPASRRVEAAYSESDAAIERLASERWSTSKIGETDSKSIAKIGKAMLVARLVDQAESLARSTSPRVQSVLATVREPVRTLAGKDWKSQSVTDAEAKALWTLMNAHLQDLAVAFGRMAALVPASGASKAYESQREMLLQLAAKKPGEDVTKEERAAVCGVLKIYAETR